jgi:Asp-tRNA(Asn)/Glu-tRNA(Gln) amidotransferase A subunit family amidase
MGRASALPVGLQLIGAWWEEAKLLRLACALEDGQDKDGAHARPPHFFEELDGLLLGTSHE